MLEVKTNTIQLRMDDDFDDDDFDDDFFDDDDQV